MNTCLLCWLMFLLNSYRLLPNGINTCCSKTKTRFHGRKIVFIVEHIVIFKSYYPSFLTCLDIKLYIWSYGKFYKLYIDNGFRDIWFGTKEIMHSRYTMAFPHIIKTNASVFGEIFRYNLLSNILFLHNTACISVNCYLIRHYSEIFPCFGF